MTEPAISIKNFSKHYFTTLLRRKTIAVENISFSVAKGSIVGLVGHNGAGKSTTIQVLLGFDFPTSGEISVLGKLPGTIPLLNKIGVVSEIHPVFGSMTAYDQLDFLGRLSKIESIERKRRINLLLEKFDLTEDATKVAGKFSKGMIQRLGFAQALLHDPEILILDEPTTGLDPTGRSLISDVIKEERAKGKTILFSTHILSDVEKLCDEVVILNKGKLAHHGSLKDSEDSWTVVFARPSPDQEQKLIDWKFQLLSENQSQECAVTSLSKVDKRSLIEKLVHLQLEINEVRHNRSKIDQLFSISTKDDSI
jgi:ABC-2 type transport system ATP-binding protein